MRIATAAGLLVTALLACHGSTRRSPAPPVTVLVKGPEAATAVVAFHRPDGSVQEVLPVDAAHMASAAVAKGALVTVGRQYRTNVTWSELVTIAAVEPGDLLTVGSDDAPDESFARATLPGAVDGSSRYVVDASCGVALADAYADTLSLRLRGCAQTTDLIALARAADGAFVAYTTALGVDVGGTTEADPANTLLGPWQTDFESIPIEVTNAPDGVQDVALFLAPRHGGRLFSSASAITGATLTPGGSASFDLRYPQRFTTSVQLEVSVYFGAGPYDRDAGGSWIILREVPFAPRSVDLSTAIPPRLSGATFSYAGDVPVASWVQARDDAGLDGTVLDASWSSSTGDHAWRAVVPPGTTSFVFPALPPELAAMGPDPGRRVTMNVTAYDIAEASGYADFRPTRFGLLDVAGPIAELPGVSTLRATVTQSR